MVTNKVLLVIAHRDYQALEYSIPKKLLEQAGFTVETASDQEGKAVASDGTSTDVDRLLGDVQAQNYDGIFLIGGSGALEHLDNETSYELVRNAVQEHKVVGAICVSTRILARAGILDNRRVTGWNDDDGLTIVLKEYKAHYVPNKDVVVDERIVTATGPHAAREFGEQIIALLQA